MPFTPTYAFGYGGRAANSESATRSWLYFVRSCWACCRARSLGGWRDAERGAAVRSRKARPAIPRGDFPPCDPRKAEYHRRISAPSICRPHASVVAAGAEEYELGALSRRVERRRPLRLLVLQKPSVDAI